MQQVAESIERANTNVGGGYIERASESLTLRGVGLLRNEEEIGNVVLTVSPEGTPVLVRHIAKVQVGAALRYGVITRDGEGEAVTGVTMMLIGANSRDVVHAVKAKVAEIAAELPPGVKIEPIYDRSDFVGRTLTTVLKNLVEGALVVTIVLALLFGTVRGALAVVLGIPASMAIALLGMHLFGVTGDLMSLGAIDFGFLVDGPIVILEAVIAALAGKQLVGRSPRWRVYRGRRSCRAAGRVCGRDHHARVLAAAQPGGDRGQDVPADGDHDGLRAVRRARVLGVVLSGDARLVRAAAEDRTARAGWSA